MYKTRIKEKWWFSQCGRTWLVCRKQLNTSGVTLNEPKTHHQTQMTCTYGYSHFIHFKTVATEVEIQFLSTWIMFPSLLPQFGSAFFSSKEGGASTFVHIMNVQVIGVWWGVFLMFGLSFWRYPFYIWWPEGKYILTNLMFLGEHWHVQK